MKFSWICLAATLAGGVARAQTTQVRPRVILVVDTSGSMLQQMDVNTSSETAATNTGGDGSISYSDALMTRSDATTLGYGLYHGFQSGAADCTPDGNEVYRGTQSRLYNAKAAVNNVLN